MDLLDTKLDHLRGRLRAYERMVVAYSGGVDSTFLALTAHETLGSAALCVTAVSPSLPRAELDAATGLAKKRGWAHATVRTQEVSREEYARNDHDRCYWCKDELFSVLEPIASNHRAMIAVGTNVDDLTDHRPGLRAAAERGVVSPLVEAGLAKDEIRALSQKAGLPTADKPSSPCLSSRFAYGVRVTPRGLRRVERAEAFLNELGFSPVRVRDRGDRATVEVARDQVARAEEMGASIRRRLVALGFRVVSVDPDGYRSGSLNVMIASPRIGPPTIG